MSENFVGGEIKGVGSSAEGAEDQAKRDNLADGVLRRYLVVDAAPGLSQLYEGNARTPAIEDRGNSLSTDLASQAVVRDIVTLARSRGWENLTVSGAEEFKRAVWEEAQRHELNVNGFEPTPLDVARQDARRASEEKERKVAEPAVRPENERQAATVDLDAETTKPSLQEGLGKRWRESAPEDRANDPDLANAQTIFVTVKAAIGYAMGDNSEIAEKLIEAVSESIANDLDKGRKFEPQLVVVPAQITVAALEDSQPRPKF